VYAKVLIRGDQSGLIFAAGEKETLVDELMRCASTGFGCFNQAGQAPHPPIHPDLQINASR
jgi:hypothetical protein